MILAIDINDRCGIIVIKDVVNSAKEEQGNAVLAIHFTVKSV